MRIKTMDLKQKLLIEGVRQLQHQHEVRNSVKAVVNQVPRPGKPRCNGILRNHCYSKGAIGAKT